MQTLILRQKEKEAVHAMAGKDKEMMAATFGHGAGSMSVHGTGINKETQMQMRIEIAQAKEERLTRKLAHTLELYNNADNSLKLSMEQVNNLEEERSGLIERNYEYKNVNIQL